VRSTAARDVVTCVRKDRVLDARHATFGRPSSGDSGAAPTP
jgi:hypothetical protein